VLEQENQKENSVSIASDSESSSKEKKHARKAVSKNLVKEQQLAQKKPYDVAGTKNEVRVQHREEKQPQVEMQQIQERKHVHYQEYYQLSVKGENPFNPPGLIVIGELCGTSIPLHFIVVYIVWRIFKSFPLLFVCIYIQSEFDQY
jgi:hypothetical protein